ncbi:carbon-nitrogen hydrolase [Cognaticolwellia beringensis]|uniref:Carbon-nitrogen hydrolase n=2 Tax=Cognaticolwellia beringensis TaxID=1967665 RepID=A0A222GC15_9GAMM|nr:carbon-nitrogen hydrolase [Cognaticolwellia beringensis]
MRVAVTQFATSLNSQENQATCIRMINEVAACKPDLIVLPEYSNTEACYEDHNQAWHEALDINGLFFQKIASQAKQYNSYILINVTLRRDLTREHQNPTIKSNISVTSCMFSPAGKLIQQSDKQLLLAQENEFFVCFNKATDAVTSAFGKLGLLAGSDIITFEAARDLALDGAQLLCNSQSSYVVEQGALQNFSRAIENNVFVATANKIGQSTPKVNLTADLVGVCHSQIISVNGKVLSSLANNKEGFTFADIDMAVAGLNKKCRPDGSEFLKQRRVELYQQPVTLQQHTANIEQAISNILPETANVAIFATYKSNEQAIEDVCHYIENNLSDIIQLPELFFIADKTISHNAEQLATIEILCTELIIQISATLRPFQYVCTSLVISGVHQGVLISEHGLFATQQQLHFCNRYQWSALGNELNIIELPLEQGNINIAILIADDANIPEIVKVAALNNVNVLLVPFDIQESSEVEFSLLSRAAENAICIVAASREKSFANADTTYNNNPKTGNKNKIKPMKSTGLIVDVLVRTASSRQGITSGLYSCNHMPLADIKVKQQYGKITKAVIHPSATVT